MRLSQLQKKDVINTSDGSKIGKIVDIEFDDTGKINSLILETVKGRLKGLLNVSEEIVIKYTSISKIGEDVLLVDF